MGKFSKKTLKLSHFFLLQDKVLILADSFSQSGKFQELMDEMKSENESQLHHSALKEGKLLLFFLSSPSVSQFFPPAKKYETGFFTQLFYLCSRRLWVNLIDLTLFWSRFILFAMMGLIIGSVYFQMGNDQDTINVCNRLHIFIHLVHFISYFFFLNLGSIGLYFLHCHIFILYVHCSDASIID